MSYLAHQDKHKGGRRLSLQMGCMASPRELGVVSLLQGGLEGYDLNLASEFCIVTYRILCSSWNSGETGRGL